MIIEYQIYCTQIKIHVSGCLSSSSGNEPPISSMSLLPKSHYNLMSLLISLDQGHIEIFPRLMVHAFRVQSRGLHQLLEISHWWFTSACSLNLHRPELHQCYTWSFPFKTCWTPSILVSCSENTTESVLSWLPPDIPFFGMEPKNRNVDDETEVDQVL